MGEAQLLGQCALVSLPAEHGEAALEDVGSLAFMAKCHESPPTHATSGPAEGDLVLALQAFLHTTLPAPGLRAWWLLTSFLSHDLATIPSSFSDFSPIL